MYICIYIYVLVIVYKTNIYIYVCVIFIFIYFTFTILFIFIAFLHHTCVTELHACMRQTARGQVASSIVDSKRLETVSVTDSVVALIQVLAMFLWISVGFSISVHGLRQTRGPAHFVHSFGSSYLGTRTCCLHPHVLSFPRCPRRCSNCRKPYGRTSCRSRMPCKEGGTVRSAKLLVAWALLDRKQP